MKVKGPFSKVIMVQGQPEIAKVNRKTGVLYLSPGIWAGLPEAEKQFVLWHEEGHLTLQTDSEFKANKYAIGKFSNAGTFTNDLGQKIMVMRSILDKADGQTSSFAFDAILGGITGITQALPVLGIGTKARQKEAAANSAANVASANAQSKADSKKSKSTITILLIGGVMLIVALAIYLTLRKK